MRAIPAAARVSARPRTLLLRAPWRLVLLAGAVALAGCQSPGYVQLASLNFNSIDPPPPKVTRLPIEHCYWWQDDEGQVWVALEHDRPWGWLPEHLVFQLSLVLEGPPAGRAREYRVTKRELRGVARFGPAQARFVSMTGIVALYREDGDQMRGSFRLQVARRGQQIFGNWGPATRYLMTGEFTAAPNESEGRRIADATEAHGWERAPTTQPEGGTPP